MYRILTLLIPFTVTMEAPEHMDEGVFFFFVIAFFAQRLRYAVDKRFRGPCRGKIIVYVWMFMALRRECIKLIKFHACVVH